MKNILGFIFGSLLCAAPFAGNLETNVYSESGSSDIIVELPDTFVLIASSVNVPLILDAEEHLRFQKVSGQWQVTKISAENFESLNLAASSAYSLHIANIDSDGKPDLVLQGTGVSGGVDTIFATNLETTPVVFTSNQDLTGSANALAFNDTDNDGRDEIYFNSEIVITSFSDVPLFAKSPSNFDGLFDESSVNLADYAVGEIPSNFSVNQGMFSYSLPIANLPAPNSAVPSLSVGYSNSPYDGDLGQGFSLNATGSISRCNSSYAVDGFYRPVKIDSQDQLCLNGQRLKLVGGTHMQADAVYYTELDSYAKVTAHGTQNGVAKYFKVWSKDGRQSVYGELNANTKALETAVNANVNSTATIAWHLAQETDLSIFGNKIEYFYDRNSTTGAHRLNKIAYGKSNTTVIDYKDKTYKTNGFQNGYPTEDSKLISAIRVLDETSNVFRKYDFSYFNNAGKHYLEKVDLCTTTSCLPPTTFNWSLAKEQSGTAASGTVTSLQSYSKTDSANESSAIDLLVKRSEDGERFEVDENYSSSDDYELVDFNNDGLQDFVFMPAVKDAETWVLLNNGNGFDEPYSVSSNLSYKSGATVDGHNFTRPLMANSSTNCIDCTADVRQFADVNGDGYPDAVIMTNFSHYNSGIFVGLNVEENGKRVISTPTRWQSTLVPTAATISNTETYEGFPNRSKSGGDLRYFFGKNAVVSFMDMNNDGKADFFGMNHSGVWVLYSDGEGSFEWGPSSKPYPEGTTDNWVTFDEWEHPQVMNSDSYLDDLHSVQYPTRLADVNGDGQIDLIYWGARDVSVALNNGNGFDTMKPWIRRFARQNVYTSGNSVVGDVHELVDVNGDGLTDLVELVPEGVKVALSNGQRFIGTGEADYDSLIDGQRLNVDAPLWSTLYTSQNPAAIFDANGDGKADLVKGRDVAFSTGTSFSDISEDYVPFEYQMAMDVNGDGQNDIVKWDADTATLEWTVAEAAPDYLVQAIHYGTGRKTLINYATQTGVHYNVADVEGELTYSLTTDESIYTKTDYTPPASTAYENAAGDHLSREKLVNYTAATANGASTDYAYPLRISRSAGLVVASVSETNGLGGYNTQSYKYKDQVVHLLGRGVQGYKEISVTNEDAQITTTNEYDLHFPLSGMVSKSTTTAPNGNVVNVEKSIANAFITTNGVWQKRTTQNQSESYDLGTGDHLYTIVTENLKFSGNNDVEQTKAVIYDEKDTSKTYTTESNNTYVSLLNDSNYRWSGKLKTSSVTKWDSINGAGEISKKSAEFDYYDNGLLKVEISEPGTDYQVKTEYTYDQWGNRLTTAVTAKNRINTHDDKAHLALSFTVADVTRTSTNVMDPEGLYLLEKRNDLYAAWGEKPTVKYTAYNECGLPTTVENILGHTSTTQYDDFCNRIGSTSPANVDEYGQLSNVTQTSTKEWVQASDTHAPNGALFKTTMAQVEAGKSPVIAYTDILGRNLRNVSQSFDGSFVYVDSVYDAEGHLAQVSRPYFPGDTKFWIKNEVDDLGRVVVNTMPGPIGGRAITSTGYLGFKTTVTDNEGHSKSTTIDAQGNLIRTDEPYGAYIENSFNAAGQLAQIDTSGQKVSYTYDQAGRQSSVFESNQGTKYFEYNGFGQPVWQIDNKGNIVEYEYDATGRPYKRYESADGNIYSETTWVYNTTGNGIGKLDKVFNDAGYIETKSYDALGRAYQTVTTVDGETFTSSAAFDDTGRVVSSTNNGFETFNTYNEFGYHEAIKTLNDPALIEASYNKLTELKQKAIDEAQQALDLATYYGEQETLYRAYAAAAEQAGDGVISAALQADLDASYATFSKAVEVADYLATDYATLAEKLISLAEQIEYQSFRPQIAQNLMSYYEEMGADTDMVTLWKALHRDAGNRLTSYVSGNGVLNTRTYDPGTAQLKTIEAGFGVIPDDILRLEYTYDRVNNVTSRVDYNLNMRETFDYDQLDRMKTSTVEHLSSGLSNSTSYEYDLNGNIEFKTGIGSYAYGSELRPLAQGQAGPNAVTSVNGFDDYSYDKNGNMLTGGGRVITWNSFNKPVTISKGDTTLEFFYTPSHARYKQVNGESTKYYHGKAYEKEVVTKGGVKTTRKKYFLYANGELVGTKLDTSDQPVGSNTVTATTEMRYMHMDALGSISVITNANGQVLDRLSFDAHGKRRMFDWRAADPDAGLLVELQTHNTRGFTGHEHLDDVGLIHMNGRLYDPEIGRFISADPTLQFPGNSQNHNRYSYVGNNPMKYVDKDGYGWFKKLLKKAKKTVKKITKAVKKVTKAVVKTVKKTVKYVWEKSKPILKNMAVMAVSTVLAGGNPILAGMISGGINAALTPGASIGDIVKAAVIGGVSASFSYTIGHGGIEWGTSIGGRVAKAAAHGVAQGTTTVMKGGSFKDGMIGGFMGSVSPVAGIGGDNLGGALARTAVAGTMGGITAEMTGGNFEDGFESAAFTQLFNDNGLDLEGHVSKAWGKTKTFFGNTLEHMKGAPSPMNRSDIGVITGMGPSRSDGLPEAMRASDLGEEFVGVRPVETGMNAVGGMIPAEAHYSLLGVGVLSKWSVVAAEVSWTTAAYSLGIGTRAALFHMKYAPAEQSDGTN